MKNKLISPSGVFFGLALGLSVFTFYKCQPKESKATAVKSLELQYMDSSASPRTDFFQWANGGWVKNYPIPATESRWGSFDELRDKNRAILHEILENAAATKDAPKGSPAQLVGDFYYSGMDSASIEKAGIEPLKAEFARIDAIKTNKDVLPAIAHMQRNGIFPLFAIYVDQDAKQSTQYALYAAQAGLGLPDRDYYFKTDSRTVNIRNEYMNHLTKMFELMGENSESAAQKAKKVMEMETKLASASMTRVEMRDPYATYHKMTIDEATKLTPSLDWKAYFAEVGAPAVQDMIISQPDFYKEVDNMLKTASVDDWKTYLEWHLIHETAGKLSSPFVNEHFRFYGTVLTGVKQLEERWKRVLGSTDNAVGEALGQEYVKKAFTPEAKKRALEMVNNLKLALKDRINALEWMSPETKQQAQHKLSTIVTKIGYPDKWRDYTGLDIDRGSYVMNVMKADSFEFQRMMNKIGKPIDRTEWGMTPPTVNAYYNPAMNEIVFPAGILQPPFFNADADDAVNYGGIGAVIGHELTHGFDDEGRQFDADGNLKEWWTKEDAEKFTQRAAYVEKQFDNYVVLDSMHINGKLTLGENIADLGGLTIAYEALQKALKEHPQTEKIDGFTPEQRFFLGWAQVWRSSERPEYLSQQVLTNPHSPSRLRVNGPVSNMPEFYKAFALQPGDPMMRADSVRARIW